MFSFATTSVPALRVVGFALMGAAALTLAGCSEEVVKTEDIIRPVKTVEIARTDDSATLVYSGSVQARTVMNMGFRVNGKIVDRKVDIGQHVKPGQLLARIDAADLQLAVDRAAADVAALGQQVKTVESALNRARQLYAQNVAPKSELESRALAFDQAKAAYASAVSALDQARNQVVYTNLEADQSGIVTSVNADVGQVVGAGTPVVAIAVDGEKEVQIAVPEMDIAHFSVGQTLTARFWADDGLELTGKVREIAGSADPASRTFAVRISLPDEDRVKLGMTATMQARIAKNDNAISVPLASLGQKDGQPIVWLLDPATLTVHSKKVEVSSFSDDGVLVSSGLGVGDVVVAAGTQFMTENLKVRTMGNPADETVTGAIQQPSPGETAVN